MKVGDLVRFVGEPQNHNHWSDIVGIVVRCIAGTDKHKVVEWTFGLRCSYPERELEVINESR